MKTAELSGINLDLAVALCAIAEGGYPIYLRSDPKTSGAPYTPHWGQSGSSEVFQPSRRGDHAVPFIEKERIFVCPTDDDGRWKSFRWADDNFASELFGPDPLTAAMRCYVSAKRRGETVDLTELLNRLTGTKPRRFEP